MWKSVSHWNDIHFHYCKLYHVQSSGTSLWAGNLGDKDEEKESKMLDYLQYDPSSFACSKELMVCKKKTNGMSYDEC